MTYDQRTRRTQKMRMLRLFLLGTVGAASVVSGITFFSLARYSSTPLKPREHRISDFQAEKVPSLQMILSEIPATARIPEAAEKLWIVTGSSSEAERDAQLEARLRHDKLTTISERHGAVAIISHQTAPGSSVKAHKKAALLLPGERLEIPVDSLGKTTRALALRCIGVTADRKDLPTRLTVGHISDLNESSSEIELSTRGETVILPIPAATSAIRKVSLTWSAQQPGILVVDGEIPGKQPQRGHRLFASVDSLSGSLEKLSEFNHTVDGNKIEKHLLPRLWPLSTDIRNNSLGIVYDALPGNLGGFVENEEARRRIRSTAGPRLEATLGKELRTLRINIQPRKCRDICPPAARISHPLQLGDFDTLVTVERVEELESAAKALLREPLSVSSDLFVHLNIVFPNERLTPRWKGALSRHGSVAQWILSSWLGGSILPSVRETVQKGEKLTQVETVLSAALHAIPLDRQAPSIVLVQQQDDPTDHKRYGEDFHLRPGEALLLGPQAKLPPIKVTSQRSIFPILTSAPEADRITYPVVVQQKNREFFLFESGWVMFPIETSSNFVTAKHRSNGDNPFAYLPLGELRGAFNAIEKIRSGYQVQALHILINGLNPDTTYSVIFRRNEAIHECFASQKSVALKRSELPLEDGTRESRLDIKTTEPQLQTKIVCIAQFSTPAVPRIDLRFLEGSEPVSPERIAVGEYSLAASLFLTGEQISHLSLPTSGEFFPSAIPPQFEKKTQPKISLWMERFSHIAGRPEAL
jgi:hypothetical protein